MTCKRNPLLLLVVIPIAACGLTDDIQDKEGFLVSESQNVVLHLIGGDQQSVKIDEIIPEPLVVQVTDAAGKPLEKQTVSFEILEGNAIILGNSKVTTALDGTASVRIKIGNALSKIKIEAKVSVPKFDESKHQVLFFASSFPGNPVSLIFTKGHSNAGLRSCTAEGENFPLPFEVELTDQYGNEIKGQSIQIDPDGNSKIDKVGSSLDSPKVFLTDESGKVTFELKAGFISGTGYNATTNVCATALLESGALPPACVTMDLTRHQYVALTNGTKVYNYGISYTITGVGPYLVVQLFFHGYKTCWEPYPNLALKYTVSITDGCPEKIVTWPFENDYGELTTNSKGDGSDTITMSVWNNFNSQPTTSRWTLSSTDTNTLHVYTGHPICD